MAIEKTHNYEAHAYTVSLQVTWGGFVGDNNLKKYSDSRIRVLQLKDKYFFNNLRGSKY